MLRQQKDGFEIIAILASQQHHKGGQGNQIREANSCDESKSSILSSSNYDSIGTFNYDYKVNHRYYHETSFVQ